MLELQVKMMNKLLKMKENFASSIKDERGDTNVISVVIILVVVIGLAVLFKDNIGSIVNNLWTTINGKATSFS